jgi:hypothetical protein
MMVRRATALMSVCRFGLFMNESSLGLADFIGSALFCTAATAATVPN